MSAPLPETYNPWSVVNLVFDHLAAEGLHPTLGGSRDPSEGARALLEAFGIQPAPEGNRQVSLTVKQQLADIRAVMLGEDEPASSSHRAEDPTVH